MLVLLIFSFCFDRINARGVSVKKLFLIVEMFIFSLLFINNVEASSFNVNITGDDLFTDYITLYVEVTDIVDINGECDGLCGFISTLNYDNTKIELVSIDSLNNFDLTNGKKVVLIRENGILENTKVLEVRFRNKSLNNLETTEIILSDIIGSDGQKDISTLNVSKTIKLRELSNNNNLKKLSINNTNINFNKDILNYNLTLENEIKQIQVTAEAEDKLSIIDGVGKYNLKVGNNVVQIKVTAEDESVKIYTINIKRKNKLNVEEEIKEEIKSSNNNLKKLSISSASINFNKDILNYNLTLENEIEQIEVTAEAEDNLSTIEGLGNYNLKVGNNVIQIKVTAEDESVKIYTINIKRNEKEIIEENKNEIKEEINEEKNDSNKSIIIFTISGIVLVILVVFIYIKRK